MILDLRHGLTAATVIAFSAACSGNSALDPAGPAAARIATLFWIMLVLGTIVAVAVFALLAVALLRGRGHKLDGEVHGTAPTGLLIWGGGVAVPAVILVLLMVLTVDAGRALRPLDAEDPLRVEVVGHMFWWEVRYPDHGVVTANEIHIPAGREVDLALSSEDVIHSFWVPRLHGKIDLTPGKTTELRIEADEPGVFRGQCAEFCGIQHANMILFVEAHEPGDFDDLMASAATTPERSTHPGFEVFTETGCAECHSVAGTSAAGRVGPDLTGIGSRLTIGAGALDNNRGNLGGWILDPQSAKPGNAMPPTQLSPVQLDDLLDFLEALEW